MRTLRLIELGPQFLKWVDDHHWSHVDSIEEADGLLFLCPECFNRNGGPVGTHSFICWRPRVPQTTSPNPGRWELTGSGYADLSLRGGPWSEGKRSVLLQGGCNAHFNITSGEVHP